MAKQKGRKLRLILSIALNGFIFFCTAYLVTDRIVNGSSGGPGGLITYGIGYLKYFTNESNVFGGVVAAIMVFTDIGSLFSGRDQTPRWAMTLHLMATTCLFLTFATTALFLAPNEMLGGGSYFALFRNDMHFFHLVNPLFSICSFTLLHKRYIYTRKASLPGMLPVVIYSGVYVTMVVFLKKWTDFYGFTFGGNYYLAPVVIIVMYIVTYIMTRILVRLHNHGVKGK